MILRLPEPPSANTYWRHVVIRGKATVLLSTEARAYRATVATLCTIEGVRPFAGEVIVHLTWSRKRRAGDLDNRIKQVLDALRGFAYTDDAQVVEIHATRQDGGTGEMFVGVSKKPT